MTVVHGWSGAPGPTSFRVKGKVSGGSTRLAVSTSLSMTSPVFFGPQTPTSDGMVDFTATGLANDTQYFWAFEIAGVLDLGTIGRSHTHAPVGSNYSYTFAYSSCAGTHPDFPASAGLAPDRVSNSPVFDRIRNDRPLFFIHGGDLHYYDIGQNKNGLTGFDISLYRDAYNTVLGTSRQGQLYREVPTVYMWDDHCYCGNDTDGSSPAKFNAALAYRERVPSYPLVEPSGAIYHTFQVGRVQFVAWDIRYNRSVVTAPDPRTMLGSTQKTWFENLLSTSTAEVLCLIQGQRWNVITAGSSNWGNAAVERAELAEMLGDHGWLSPMRTFMVSGDVHAMGMNTGATNQYGGFPLFHGASLDSTPAGGPVPGMDLGGVNNRGNYLTIDVTDTGGSISIRANGWQP